MGRKARTSSRPSFFKVLMQDYTTRLRLPHAFVQKYGEFLPAESVKLRTSSREIWDVELEEIDDDEKYCCCFVGGWSKFVEDLELKMFEFLVFWFSIGESTFDVSVYGVNACAREISAKSLPAVDSHADEDFNFRKYCHNVPADKSKKRSRSWIPEIEAAGTDSQTKSGNFGDETHPRFAVVLTESRKSRVCLPKKFAEAAHLIGKRTVVLEYPPKQRSWPVMLDKRRRPNFTLDMARGWSDFRKENRLVLGRTYSFVFDPTKNVIQVKEHKKNTVR